MGYSKKFISYSRHPDAEDQAKLLEFIFKLSKLAENRTRDGALAFLCDLLQISMPCQSARIDSTFVSRIITFIHTTAIKEHILGAMSHIMVS